jgi:hypothetical protein
MGIDYTEWHRREIEKAERTHTEHLARHDRGFYGCLAKLADDDRDGSGDRENGDGGGGASEHVLSRLADLAVESQKFSSRAEALNWLISHPNGHAFTRLHKAAATAKDPPMDTVYSIMKDGSLAGVCAPSFPRATPRLPNQSWSPPPAKLRPNDTLDSPRRRHSTRSFPIRVRRAKRCARRLPSRSPCRSRRRWWAGLRPCSMPTTTPSRAKHMRSL